MPPGHAHAYVYLHGFASSPRSHKGTAMQRRFAERGIDLHMPDLNRPSFEALSQRAMLDAVDEVVAAAAPGTVWRLIGSSMGGHLAAWWASLHPGVADRLVLLCPGFDLASRWPDIVGAERFRQWERDGALSIPDADGKLRPMHFGLVRETRTTPPEPDVACPTLIVHGTRDEIVPVTGSRRYAASRPHVRLIEVDDDHALGGSLDRIGDEALAFFGL